jgi:predicted lipid-binding transport protein (Tim44 family)
MSTDPQQFSTTGSQGGAGQGQGQENLLDLLRQLTRQGSHLAEQQLQLVQAEVRESANDVKAAVGGMLGAAVAGIAGLGVLLMGLSYLLADAIENLGLATLIVGVVTLIIALILYSSARKKMNAADLSAERSQRTLARTPDAVRGDL